MKLILASQSRSRRRMLEAAGVPFEAVSSGVDEESVKASLRTAGADGAAMARALARAKALAVSQRHPQVLVLGADQTLELGKEVLDKPISLEDASAQLARMSGGTHSLPTAAALAEGGEVLEEFVSVPRITFRPLSKAFINHYLNSMGDRALQTVGGCEVEGLGSQLIEKIEGDFFAVLGLPLLEVLACLRERKLIAS